MSVKRVVGGRIRPTQRFRRSAAGPDGHAAQEKSGGRSLVGFSRHVNFRAFANRECLG